MLLCVCVILVLCRSFYRLSDQASKEDLSSDSPMKYFLKLKRSEQHSEIAKNLESISETSKETYIRIMKEFKIESQKAKKKESKTTDMQGVYHKLLYQIILDTRETIRQIERQKREQERMAMREELSEITRKLIVGEGVSFSKHIRSETLAELLLDLNDLETNSKVSVNGEPIVCSEYHAILDDLLDCEFEFADCSILDDLPQANPHVSTKILSQVCPFPNMYVNSCSGISFFKNAILTPSFIFKIPGATKNVTRFRSHR